MAPPSARRSPTPGAPVGLAELGPREDDAALVLRALDGDRWAEEALYRRHVRRVGDTVMRVLGRSAEAEDVVQDTFLKAFSSLPTLRDPDLFVRWLMRIAMNYVRGKLRRRKVLRAIGLDRTADDVTLERTASPTAPPDVRAELAALDRALRELPIEPRLAWSLRVIEGYSLPEVAGACDCSLATAKRRISAAQARVDRHLGTETPSEEEER